MMKCTSVCLSELLEEALVLQLAWTLFSLLKIQSDIGVKE